MHGNLAERLNFGFAVVGHGQMVKSVEKLKFNFVRHFRVNKMSCQIIVWYRGRILKVF